MPQQQQIPRSSPEWRCRFPPIDSVRDIATVMLGDVDVIVGGAFPRVRAVAGLAALDDDGLRALMAQVIALAVQGLLVDEVDLDDPHLRAAADEILQAQARAGLHLEDAQQSSYLLVEELWFAARRASGDADVIGEVGDRLLSFLQQANALIAHAFRELDDA